MTGILIATHGSLGDALLGTAAMILGEPRNAAAVGLQPGEGRDLLEARITQAVQGLDQGDGILLLTDVMGGSPFQAGVLARGDRPVKVLTGVNLPMVLESLTCRDGKTLRDLDDFSEQVQRAAKKGIREV